MAYCAEEKMTFIKIIIACAFGNCFRTYVYLCSLIFLFAWSRDSRGFLTGKSIKCSLENKNEKDIKSSKDIVNICPTEERVVTIRLTMACLEVSPL